jgi:hypothetical protein
MHPDQDRRRWLTRTEAAKQLGTTIASIRRLEGRTLFPETIAGIERFRPSEIAAILEGQSPLSQPVSPKPRRPRWRNLGEAPKSLDVRSVPSTDDHPTDLAASSNAVTALFEKLLGNH